MEQYEQYPVSLFNSLSGKKERFEPLEQGYVGMYVCGPTVYNDVHLGNVRTFLTFDVIYRYLIYLGYKVRYVRNITDVGHLESDADEGEDKIAKKARLEKLEPMEVVKHYTNGFHETLASFNLLPPNIEPSATGHILEQIEMVEKLIDKGLAYEVNGSVYFDVSKYNETHHYGILSKRDIEDMMESGRSLESQEEKRNKIDFALWKKASPSHIMRWKSPWSEGFPGWHLECSVMSTKYLGETFDIHGGGMDLKFPHHECEIAQATAAYGKSPVKYWIHTNMLTVNGQKMSKSLGNSFLPHQLFSGDHPLLDQGYSPMTVRFFILQSHYSSTLDFSNEALKAAEKGLKKLMNALEVAQSLHHPGGGNGDPGIENQLNHLSKACFEQMSDDFNSAKVLATLFAMSGKINDFKSGNLNYSQVSSTTFNAFLKVYCDFTTEVLGLKPEGSEDDGKLKGTLEILLELRKKARESRNYELSDHIRDQLKAIGIIVKDGKNGEMTYIFE